MKKIGYLACFLFLTLFLVTGCAKKANKSATPAPAPATMQPSTLMNPSPTTNMPILSDLKDGAQDLMGLTTLQDVQQSSEEMEDAVEQLSEVDDAYVIAHGNMALVGLVMNSQYQGEVDERLQKMVLGRIQTIEKSITEVAVTDDAEKVNRIESLSEKLDGASDLSEILPMLEEMMQGMTVYKE